MMETFFVGMMQGRVVEEGRLKLFFLNQVLGSLREVPGQTSLQYKYYRGFQY
jgi:hypothetical protein